jgi:hypothetical protein
MDPIEILIALGQDHAKELRNIARAQGDMSRELKQGREVHQHLITATQNLHGRVSLIERAMRQKPIKNESSLIALIRAGCDFIEAVASLKELALAIAIIMAAFSIVSHPETAADLIHTYIATGQKEHG